MPYHISQSDSWRGGQRYQVSIVDEFDAATARHLSDWLSVACLNREAGFVIDLSRATDIDHRALERLLARQAQLGDSRRLELVGGEERARLRRLATLPAYAPLAAPLLSISG